MEEHAVEIDEDNVAKVKAASRDFLLLQKAERFLLRKIMKARDVFDISNDVAPVKRLADSFFIVSDTLLYPRYARPFSVVDDFYSRPT